MAIPLNKRVYLLKDSHQQNLQCISHNDTCSDSINW